MGGVVADGELVNVSASGALLLSTLPVRLHSQVFVQFQAAPPLSRRSVTVRADVIRTIRGGFALEWEEFSAPPIRSLLRDLGQQPTYDQVVQPF